MNHTLRTTLPFTGRSSELSVLARLRADAHAGRGSVVLLSGDGGIGKTRLLMEAARSAQHDGWQLAIGRAYPLESASPYAPFTDALSPLLAALEPGALTRLTRGDRATPHQAPWLVDGRRPSRVCCDDRARSFTEKWTTSS